MQIAPACSVQESTLTNIHAQWLELRAEVLESGEKQLPSGLRVAAQSPKKVFQTLPPSTPEPSISSRVNPHGIDSTQASSKPIVLPLELIPKISLRANRGAR